MGCGPLRRRHVRGARSPHDQRPAYPSPSGALRLEVRPVRWNFSLQELHLGRPRLFQAFNPAGLRFLRGSPLQGKGLLLDSDAHIAGCVGVLVHDRVILPGRRGSLSASPTGPRVDPGVLQGWMLAHLEEALPDSSTDLTGGGGRLQIVGFPIGREGYSSHRWLQHPGSGYKGEASWIVKALLVD